MVADGLLTRQRYREVPPRVDYELTDRARDLMPVLASLARWGYEWAWGPPREGEAVDVGAILRLAPGLLSPPREVRGSVACTVTQCSHGRPERTYVLTSRDRHVSVAERDAGPGPDATVTGTERDWIAAFGPDAGTSRLSYTGQRALAEALLDGVAAVAARVSAAA